MAAVGWLRHYDDINIGIRTDIYHRKFFRNVDEMAGPFSNASTYEGGLMATN